MFRSTISRVARPMGARTYADKTITETVGDALKNVAKTFSADGGEVGSKFKSDGSIGQQGEKVGGAFSSKEGGAVGSQFEKDGSIGSTAQKASDKAWDLGKEIKGEPIKK